MKFGTYQLGTRVGAFVLYGHRVLDLGQAFFRSFKRPAKFRDLGDFLAQGALGKVAELDLPEMHEDRTVAVPLPEGFIRARADLREAAQGAATDVSINHAVLRRAVEAGEGFLQRLFAAAADPPAVYGVGDKQDDPPAGGPGVIVDRSA